MSKIFHWKSNKACLKIWPVLLQKILFTVEKVDLTQISIIFNLSTCFFLIFSLNPPWWKNPCLIGLNFNSSSLCLLHNFILGSRVLSSFYITHYFPSCHPTIPSWNNTIYFSHPKFLTIYFFAKIDNTKYLIVIYWFQTYSAKIQTSQIVLKIRAKNAEQFKSFHFTQIKFKFCCQGMENVFWGSHLSQYKDST